MMKLPSPRAFLTYRHGGGRYCHNAVLHGGRHRGMAWLAYDSGGSLSNLLGGLSGSAAQVAQRLGGVVGKRA